jgi:hypothetical protein
LECCDEYLNISYSLFQKCFAQNRVWFRIIFFFIFIFVFREELFIHKIF